MSKPCVWELICTHCKIPCHDEQWSDRKVQCPDRITTGHTCYCIYHLSCSIEHMTKPGVRKLACTNCKIPRHDEQWSDSKVQRPDRITTTGRTCYCINHLFCSIEHMTKPCVWK